MVQCPALNTSPASAQPVNRRSLLLAAIMSGALAACARRAPASLIVFAAISLQDVLQRIVADRGQTNAVRFAFAATSALARQIAHGAPADIFISADSIWMDDLAARGLLRADTRTDLLTNRLALVAPAATRLTVDLSAPGSFTAALADGRLAIADPNAVPAGRYARAALEHLSLWPTAEPRLARAENVRAALAFVARGEAPLGIVYDTDARSEPRVQIIALFPEESHPRIVYPAAILARAEHQDAQSFLDSLRDPDARAIFEHAGFRLL